ncbi:hypothetical protein ACFVVU_22475 [Kitasatospora sp. NPDC057965]|uniref:hypothetical protein n=1 Tax=Kitasatospora sp. NPDC057965 TaxID=3346291 RepID=UPI0036DC426C
MTEAQNIAELLFGPRDPEYQGPLRYNLDFRRVNLTTPVLPDIVEHQDVEWARQLLRAGTLPENPQSPLPDDIILIQDIVRDQLSGYVETDRPRADRLYVLDFQGPRRQYTMFGHSTDLPTRIAEHCQAATPHGYALLGGWASPGVDDAYSMEQVALRLARHEYGWHYRERFYEMPLTTGMNYVRAVFELNSDWRTRNSTAHAAGEL